MIGYIFFNVHQSSKVYRFCKFKYNYNYNHNNNNSMSTLQAVMINKIIVNNKLIFRHYKVVMIEYLKKKH